MAEVTTDSAPQISQYLSEKVEDIRVIGNTVDSIGVRAYLEVERHIMKPANSLTALRSSSHWNLLSMGNPCLQS